MPDTVIGQYTTFDSEFLAPDIRATAALVEPSITRTWDIIPEVEPGISRDLRWYDSESNSLQGEVRTAWNVAGTAGLAIDDALAKIINIGDVIRVESEYVVVKAVDRSIGAATIDVHERGHGGSTPATHAAALIIYIVGSAHVEGTVDGEGIIEDNIKRINYPQLVEEPIHVSFSAANQSFEDSAFQNKLEEARQKVMVRALKKLNKSVLFGLANEGTKSKPSSAGGIKHFLENDSNNININVGGAISEAKLKSALKEIVLRGGIPNLILCSVDAKMVINGFNRTTVEVQTQTPRTDRTAGSIIDYYEFDGIGRIAVMADPLLTHAFGELYILNVRKLKKFWMKNDAMRFAPEPANSREFKETLQGRYSFVMKDSQTDFARLFGII